MTRKAFILATAGHVDHGKSALVRTLTSADPDRLPEEKLRGMTIELGFAHLTLESSEGSGELGIGVVDVPGHEDFVRNMVAGVGSIDGALLVVAADDGWMPQTEEHVQILSYLGVRNAVVALTKSDLAVDLPAVERSIRQRLEGTPFSEAKIIPTSVKEGRGIHELRNALARMFTMIEPGSDVAKPRLAIDRAFVLKGIGTVVTGTLSGGILLRGEEVVVQPAGLVTRIRGMQTHGRDVESAGHGMRVALNLPDIAVASGARRDRALKRGDVITRVGIGDAVQTLDVLLDRSARSGSARLRSGTMSRIHHGTAAVAGRVRLLDSPELSAGADTLARIALAEPIFGLVGDHFIIRDWSEQHTLAGGTVLDVNPPGKRISGPHREMLSVRARARDLVGPFVMSQVMRDGFCESSTILHQSIFAENEIQAAVGRACREGVLLSTGSVVAAPKAWDALMNMCRQAVDGFHSAHPERAGMPLAELERLVSQTATTKGAWEAVLSELEKEDFRRDSAIIRRTSHRLALPPRLEAAGRRLRATLAKVALDPPARRELARDDIGIQALKFLIANGEAVELGIDLVMSAEAYAQAVSAVRNHIKAHGPATVSQLKSALGSSRRIMVPLVERMDRDGITHRQGDLRTLK